jgi:hypothetical protein
MNSTKRAVLATTAAITTIDTTNLVLIFKSILALL